MCADVNHFITFGANVVRAHARFPRLKKTQKIPPPQKKIQKITPPPKKNPPPQKKIQKIPPPNNIMSVFGRRSACAMGK